MTGLPLATILLAAGLLFVILEVFIPSFGVLSILAGCCMIGSLWVAYQVSFLTGSIFLLVDLGSVIGTVFLSLRVLQNTSFGRKLFLQGPRAQDVRGAAAYQKDPKLLGREGRALTDLRPAGTAKIDGRRLDVMAQTGYIEAGTAVQVVEARGNRVVVRAIETAGASGEPADGPAEGAEQRGTETRSHT